MRPRASAPHTSPTPPTSSSPSAASNTFVVIAPPHGMDQGSEVGGSTESRLERVRKLLSSPLMSRRKSNVMSAPSTTSTATFGVPLESLMVLSRGSSPVPPSDGSNVDCTTSQQPHIVVVPFVICRLCHYIQLKGLNQEGLFRVSGNARLMEKLRASFDQTGDAPLEKEGDVTSAASLLKQFFRELPEPLIPEHMHASFLTAYQMNAHDGQELTRRLKSLVERLPTSNFNVLKYLCHFLYQVSLHEERTRMTPSALGICFGPNLFRFPEDIRGLKEQAITNQVVTVLISEYVSIFEGDMDFVDTSTARKLNDDAGLKPCEEDVENMDPSSLRVHNTRKMGGGAHCVFPMEPLSVLIPAMDNSLSIETDCSASCSPAPAALMIDESVNHPTITRARSVKRKERKSSDDGVPRSASEERPMSPPGPMTHRLRRCSSSEEMITSGEVVSTDQSHASSSPIKCPRTLDLMRLTVEDPSPHPPHPKRRELSRDRCPEQCRAAERETQLFYPASYNSSGSQKQSSSGQKLAKLCNPPDNIEPSSDVPRTPKTPRDGIPPLDLATVHQEEPILSEHRFSWPMVQTLSEKESEKRYEADDAIMHRTNSYEAPLSPSAYRSYLSHRTTHLDHGLPPSPPIDTADGMKVASLREEERVAQAIKETSRKIRRLKKRVAVFDEQFAADHGFRPSHAEKMSRPETKHLLLEISRLRKELRALRSGDQLPEPLYGVWPQGALTAYRNMVEGRAILSSDGESATLDEQDEPSDALQKAFNETLRLLVEKRRQAKRPDLIEEMSRDQISDEKYCLQKALLRFESLNGRPTTRADRNLVRPLYERYRNIKRIMIIQSTGGAADKSLLIGSAATPELQPIIEHVQMDFTSQSLSTSGEINDANSDDDVATGNDLVVQNKDAIVSPATVVEVDVKMMNSSTSPSANEHLSSLHELPLNELVTEQNRVKLEKRRLRRILRDFELEFQQRTGRKVLKEDRQAMESTYNEYKHIKARLRLVDALISKRLQRREMIV